MTDVNWFVLLMVDHFYIYILLISCTISLSELFVISVFLLIIAKEEIYMKSDGIYYSTSAYLA